MRIAAAQPQARALVRILPVAALAAIAAACGSSSETVTAPAQARCAIATQAGATSFSPDGGAGTIRVETERECTWTAASEAPWISVSPANGQGDATINFTVAPNEAPQERQAAITVNDRRQPISQQGRPCRFDLSTGQLSVPAAGGEHTIGIDASSDLCGWTAAAEAPWITITSGAEGSGDGTVTVQVAAAAGPPRSGTLTVAGQTVRVDQGTGCTFTVSPTLVEVGPDGGDRTVSVDASNAACAWTASSGAPWIAVTPGDGSGSGSVAVRVAPSAEPQRTATLTIAGRTVTVNQGSGCRAALDPQSASVAAAGGNVSIGVQSGGGCPWTATTSETWISVASGTQGSGSGRVELRVAANTGPERSGAVTIAGLTFSVRQESGCSYDVAPTAHNLPGLGGVAAVNVSTAPGCPWQAGVEVPWLSLSTQAGTGPGTVRVTAQPNNTPARTGTAVVAGQSIAIEQASLCTFLLLPPFHDLGANGGNGNVLVIVTGGCSWTAESTASWIRLTSGASGTGDGLVQFVVAPNTGSARTGFVIIAGQEYRVNQAGR